jgi:hypothetical protein
MFSDMLIGPSPIEKELIFADVFVSRRGSRLGSWKLGSAEKEEDNIATGEPRSDMGEAEQGAEGEIRACAWRGASKEGGGWRRERGEACRSVTFPEILVIISGIKRGGERRGQRTSRATPLLQLLNFG